MQHLNSDGRGFDVAEGAAPGFRFTGRRRRAGMPDVRALWAACLFGLACATAAHAQATIADCEKIQAADAYNQCLAKFGPTSKVKSLEPERPGDIKDSSAEAAASAGAPKGAVKPPASAKPSRGLGRTKVSRHGRVVRSRAGGRKRMTFSVSRRRHR